MPRVRTPAAGSEPSERTAVPQRPGIQESRAGVTAGADVGGIVVGDVSASVVHPLTTRWPRKAWPREAHRVEPPSYPPTRQACVPAGYVYQSGSS